MASNERNERGNTVDRRFIPNGERYQWDFDEKFRAKGWEQYDTNQDAWYFGVWINKKLLQILTYAEGDITLISCHDENHFNAEIKAMNEFYGEGFIAKTIDENGKMTVYRQDRSQFFMDT